MSVPPIVPCPPHIKDRSGFQNDRMTVLGFSRRVEGTTFWVGKCECGWSWEIRGNNLSRTKQCKRCRQNQSRVSDRQRELSKTRIYYFWVKVKEQAGSRLVSQWNDLIRFAEDVHIPKGFTTIVPDKGTVDKNTLQIVPRQRKSQLLTCHGQTHNLLEWAKILGISRERIRQKLLQVDEGVPLEEILVPAFTLAEAAAVHVAKSFQKRKKLKESYGSLLDGEIHSIVAEDIETLKSQLRRVAAMMNKKTISRTLGNHLLFKAIDL